MRHAHRLGFLLLLALLATPPAARLLTRGWSRPPVVDTASAQAGETLFMHDWKVRDSLSPSGDGLGPVFNASSCVACHNQSGIGGGGGRQHNVTMFTINSRMPGGKPRMGVVHAKGVGVRETLSNVHPQLPPISQPALDTLVALPGSNGRPLSVPADVFLSQRNTPALFGSHQIDTLDERAILANERQQRLRRGMAPADGENLPVGRSMRLPDGRLGRFGWKAQTSTLAGFVQAACANELGLSNPGQMQPAPLSRPDMKAPGYDLTQAQCDQLTAFVASLPQPTEKAPSRADQRDAAHAGRALFEKIGCADCHTPDLGSVEGIYSDLLLHRMGMDLAGGGAYYGPPLPPEAVPADGPLSDEWRTPPLWGVADSAPYLHDGRAATLDEAIRLHKGQGQTAANRYEALKDAERRQLIAFLNTLRAP